MADTLHEPGNAADFMAGVALFDELLREAFRRADSWDELQAYSPGCDAMKLDGAYRSGQPLTLYALPFVEAILKRPELARGFAGALGDYVGMVQGGRAPEAGDQYTHLTFEDCVRIVPAAPISNVITFNRAHTDSH